MMGTKRSQLYELLYDWIISGTCDDCQHIITFRDGDMRHPCNRCECYDKFKIADNLREDIKDKVNEILKRVNNGRINIK